MKEVRKCPECDGTGVRCYGVDADIKPVMDKCPVCKGKRFVLVDPEKLVDISK